MKKDNKKKLQQIFGSRILALEFFMFNCVGTQCNFFALIMWLTDNVAHCVKLQTFGISSEPRCLYLCVG